jgi:hypothetical protein
MKTKNYMIDVAFELTTGYEENKIPYTSLIKALEKRLETLKKNPDREAFGIVDFYEVEV